MYVHRYTTTEQSRLHWQRSTALLTIHSHHEGHEGRRQSAHCSDERGRQALCIVGLRSYFLGPTHTIVRRWRAADLDIAEGPAELRWLRQSRTLRSPIPTVVGFVNREDNKFNEFKEAMKRVRSARPHGVGDRHVLVQLWRCKCRRYPAGP